MTNSIFASYTQRENIITAAIIQVLKSLPINLVEQFLQMFTEETEKSFFLFKSQSKQPESTPDAEISTNFRLLFETKIKENSVKEDDQLHNHATRAAETKSTLVYLTPDLKRPQALEKYKFVKWKSFSDLYALIEEILRSPIEIVTDRDAFLLRNLQLLIDEQGLLPEAGMTVVVAASRAWPFYKENGVYICQPGRSFRHCEYMAFYADGEIKRSVAKILKHEDNANLFDDKLKDDLGLKFEPSPDFHQACQIFKLSKCKDSATFRLDQPIKNDLVSGTRKIAFTQGQRYTTLEALKNAKTTFDLKE